MEHTVLLVDADRVSLDELAGGLRDRHYRVHTAASGQEAIAILGRSPADVVIVDESVVAGPEGELIGWVAKNQPDAVRIALASHVTMPQVVEAMAEAGVFQFLAKPCHPLLLRQTVRRAIEYRDLLLERRRSRRREEEAAGAPTAEVAVAGPTSTGTRALPGDDVLRDARILVVDDTALNVAIVTDELREQGCHVLSAASGEAALALAASEHPDAILLDVMMPGISGIEVCRRLKASAASSGIPVILLTSLAGQQSVITGLDAGADDYITKPFTAEILVARLRAVLRVKRAYDLAAQAKSEFLANMSHEIRTPLTAILGYADLLCEIEAPDPEHQTYLQTIHRNGEILLQLINDILDLSKVEAGKMTLEQVECSPWRIANEVEALLRVRAESKGLRLVLEGRFPLPRILRTDPTRLRQILVNLVGNAIKFTDLGEVRIIVGLDDAGRPRPWLRFDVIDTGVGMNPQQLAGLFRPFTQADSTTTRRFGGTGLGLTISKRLAGALGGDIEVRSEAGLGSTFSLVLDPGPLEGVPMLDAPPTATKTTPRPAPSAPPQSLHGRVLLAEDGFDTQRLIVALLEKAGLEIEVAENGRIALEKVAASSDEGRPFDLILMDMQMPELDGYGATRMLRQMGWDGPIVALTASAMLRDRQRCLAAGCNDYHTKPINREAFFKMLARHLRPDQSPAAFCESDSATG